MITSCLQVKGSGNYRDANVSSCLYKVVFWIGQISSCTGKKKMEMQLLQTPFLALVLWYRHWHPIHRLILGLSLSFPHLIHPAADSSYLSLCMADICRVWPNLFTIPQGEQSSNNFHLRPGSPALTMKPVCQVIWFHSFYQTCQIHWIIAILQWVALSFLVVN